MSIKNKISIKGDIKAGGSVNIGNTQIQAEEVDIIEWDKGISEEEWDDMMQDAEDFMFNASITRYSNAICKKCFSYGIPRNCYSHAKW